MKKAVSLALSALLAGTSIYSPIQAQASVQARAQTQAPVQDPVAEVDKIFSWATPATPGCAVAVSQHGRLVVNREYGLADLERNVPVSPDTVFDIGSVQKQFVAASVLLLVDEGQLSLGEDVRTYIPELPDTGHRVTVDHLLTQTSGVRDWTAILPLAATSSDALTIALRQRGLNFAPGEEWAYSNNNYVLLKEIVGRVSGTTFGEFARQRLFEPLGMTLTQYQYDWREVVKNRALAYEQQGGRWRVDMLLDNARGGGGALLSTAGDLLKWNDALTNSSLGAFVTEKIQEPARLSNGRTLSYARGLNLDNARGTRVVWHSGSANAYNSALARFPEHGLSVAILCNAGDIATTGQFTARILDVFVPPTGAGTPSAPAASVAVPDLNAKAGLFFKEETGEPMRLVVERTTLRVAGGPALTAVTADTFRPASPSISFRSLDDFELRFVSLDQVVLTSMEGQKTTYRRAKPYAPTAADLQAFAGRYESAEIGGVFQVEATERSLLVRLAHAPATAAEFVPVAPDTFQIGMVMLRFKRDQSGRIVALGYSNPLLRDIPFTRLGDGAGAR